MKTFRFLEFQIYKEGKLFYTTIISLTKPFPKQYWELADQMRRSALSVCLNIAEGSAKRSDKDFNRFIENSLGSINEAVACLDIAFNEGLIAQELSAKKISQAEAIAKQLGGFSKKLKSLG